MRLGRWHLGITIAVLAAVSFTGLAWFVRHDLMEREPDDLQRLLLAAHGIFAYGAVLAFGSALPTHARLAWRHRRNIASGLSMIVTIGTLELTALWLYYGSEQLRDLARWVHMGVGLVALVPGIRAE
jgi:Sec-independent protein secretion pathway component TatC